MKGLEVYGAHDDNTPKPELSLGDVVENTSNSEEESTKTLSSLSEDTNTLQKQEAPLDELTSSTNKEGHEKHGKLGINSFSDDLEHFKLNNNISLTPEDLKELLDTFNNLSDKNPEIIGRLALIEQSSDTPESKKEQRKQVYLEVLKEELEKINQKIDKEITKIKQDFLQNIKKEIGGDDLSKEDERLLEESFQEVVKENQNPGEKQGFFEILLIQRRDALQNKNQTTEQIQEFEKEKYKDFIGKVMVEFKLKTNRDITNQKEKIDSLAENMNTSVNQIMYLNIQKQTIQSPEFQEEIAEKLEENNGVIAEKDLVVAIQKSMNVLSDPQKRFLVQHEKDVNISLENNKEDLLSTDIPIDQNNIHKQLEDIFTEKNKITKSEKRDEIIEDTGILIQVPPFVKNIIQTSTTSDIYFDKDTDQTLIDMKNGMKLLISNNDQSQIFAILSHQNNVSILPIKKKLKDIGKVIDTETAVSSITELKMNQYFKDSDDIRELSNFIYEKLQNTSQSEINHESIYKNQEFSERKNMTKVLEVFFRSLFSIEQGQIFHVNQEILNHHNMLNDKGKIKPLKELIKMSKLILVKEHFDKHERSKYI